MDKKTKIHIIIITILWLFFAIAAYLALSCGYFKVVDGTTCNSNSYIDYMNAFYVAAGALFTGLAFTITFYHLKQQSTELKNQNERLGKQISLDVFTDAFGHVLDSANFREAKKYIYSKQFKEDTDTLVSSRSTTIRKEIKKCKDEFDKKTKDLQTIQDNREAILQKTDEIQKEFALQIMKIREMDEYNRIKNRLSIEDFREIKTPIQNGQNKNTNQNEDDVKTTIASYERIKYFCDRMEYLGMIHFTYNNAITSEAIKSNNIQDQNLILDFFGYDIISTYEILKTFIQSSLIDYENDKAKGNLYYYFTKLYYCAKDREKECLVAMKKEMYELSLNESNNQQIKE